MTARTSPRRLRTLIMTLLALVPLAASVPTIGSSAGQDPSQGTQTTSATSASASPSASTSPSPSAAPYPGLPGLAAGQIPTFLPAPPAVRPQLPSGPLAPIMSRVPTTQPVVFITIDDGHVRRPEAQALLRAAKVPVTLFLISSIATKDPRYFEPFTHTGAVIEAHTVTHPFLRGKSYATQKHEICGGAETLGNLYGRRPVLFRPPYGEYDQTTLRAAHDCGMKAVLRWREATNAGHVFYQTPEKKLHSGDVILMHFRQAFVADFMAILAAIKQAGLTPALLEDYVG